MHLDLGPALAGELIAAGITADRRQMNLVNARVFWRGAELFEQLRDRFGQDLVPSREAFILRLGVGAVMTDFATAQIPLTQDCRRALVGLGGLLILKVSAFDKLLDTGRPTPALCFSADPPSRPPRDGSPQSVLFALQAEYFRQLDNLPRKQPALRALADTAFRRMYAAELQSVSERPVGRSTWWRKNVLPIVMLGLPAWIAADSFDSCRCMRHLMWLARVGEFFGWVDDCVDYTEDVTLGQANRIDGRLCSISKEQFVRRIAASGKQLLAQWDLANGPSTLRSTFGVIVWSWIENKRAETVS